MSVKAVACFVEGTLSSELPWDRLGLVKWCLNTCQCHFPVHFLLSICHLIASTLNFSQVILCSKVLEEKAGEEVCPRRGSGWRMGKTSIGPWPRWPEFMSHMKRNLNLNLNTTSTNLFCGLVELLLSLKLKRGMKIQSELERRIKDKIHWHKEKTHIKVVLLSLIGHQHQTRNCYQKGL